MPAWTVRYVRLFARAARRPGDPLRGFALRDVTVDSGKLHLTFARAQETFIVWAAADQPDAPYYLREGGLRFFYDDSTPAFDEDRRKLMAAVAGELAAALARWGEAGGFAAPDDPARTAGDAAAGKPSRRKRAASRRGAVDPLFGRRTLESLVQPLRIGSPVAEGYELCGAHVADTPPRHVYRLAPAALEVSLVRRDETGARYDRTQHFDVWVRTPGEGKSSSPLEERVLRSFIEIVRRNDREPLSWPEMSALPDEPGGVAACADTRSTLYLAPGHLGDPRDLTPRTLHALRTSRVFFVEGASRGGADDAFAHHGVEMCGRRIVELRTDGDANRAEAARVLEAASARGEDMCLFGANEGIPAFHDPGKEVVIEAAARSDRIRIQSLGGASVLGMALMRVEREVREFAFLGVDDPPIIAERIREYASRLARPSFVVCFFLAASDPRGQLVEIVERLGRPDLELWLCCDLTLPREAVLRWAPRESPPPPLRDDAKVVVFASGRRPGIVISPA